LLFTVLMLANGPLAAEPLPRWSVATNWTDGWPSDWGHAEAARTETSGQWTIHHGELRLPGGTLKLRDAERVSHLAAGATEVRRRWEWTGDVVLSYVCVWDVALPLGRLADHAFKTRGWTSVSA
jgi:hypothetical protein